jgi:polyhydroxybutyrate depolymerase
MTESGMASGRASARSAVLRRLAARTAAAALLLFAQLTPAEETPALQRFSAGDRGYLVHVPPPDTGAPPSAGWPLVLVLHGAGGNARIALRVYRWPEEADHGHFIVAGLNALPPAAWLPAGFLLNPRVWNNGDPANAGHPVSRHDDVGYVRAVLDDIERRFPVDRNRVYATGFSSGAGMTQRLGVELSDRFAAIAPVAGIRLQDQAPARPLSVLMIFGRADPIVPYDGGRRSTPWGDTDGLPPVSQSAAAWTRDLHCPAQPAVTHPTAQIERERWQPCADGTEVEVVTVDALGHHWGGSQPDRLPEAATGPVNDAFDDTGAIWHFFATHPRRSSAAAGSR